MVQVLPISAIVPTYNRSEPLARTLNSLAQQSTQPVEMIVVDASLDQRTQHLCQSEIPKLVTQIKYYQATATGAATQRNQAMLYATQDVIWLMDDDILLEAECLTRLWLALYSDPQLGGVNAMIANQRYLPPGKISRLLFRFLQGHSETSYAGKCIGPALNLLPEDEPYLPEVVPVEWLNSTCTLYRRAALPQPLFSDFFQGYSLMEDLALSLTVAKQWKLANARTARLFHDSQPGEHKNNAAVLAKMSFVNRHYVMTQILQQRQLADYFKLVVLQVFEVVATLHLKKGWFFLPLVFWGKLEAIAVIFVLRNSWLDSSLSRTSQGTS